MQVRKLMVLTILFVSLTACVRSMSNVLPNTPTSPAGPAVTAAQPGAPVVEATSTITATTPITSSAKLPIVIRTLRPEEAILILEPGPGSRVVSPLHVSGIANPTFEQALVVQILLDDGSVLATSPAQINAEAGKRGPFAVDVPFTISGERQAFIQVFDVSPRDGVVTHLSSVGVTLAEGGEANIIPVENSLEQIVIRRPSNNEEISGGVVRVEGIAIASFEQALVVEVQDMNGTVVGTAPVTVNAPDLGKPGTFSVDVPYTVTTPGVGRIVVRDISPAFGGDVHRSSVEVNLAP